MDQFVVPKFIEHKAKIIGPLTFQQFIYIGSAGAIAFFLYFVAPLSFFFIGTIMAVSCGVALAFVNVNGRPLPQVMTHFLNFSFAPKLYLWKKKVGPPPMLVKERKPKAKQVEGEATPTIVGKSHLNDLSTKIETKM